MSSHYAEKTEEGNIRKKESEVTPRLQHACRGHSCRELSELTGLSTESVRRYLRGEQPCAKFLARLCQHLRISADWILLGRAPMHTEERETPVKAITDAQLVEELAGRLECKKGSQGSSVGELPDVKPECRTLHECDGSSDSFRT